MSVTQTHHLNEYLKNAIFCKSFKFDVDRKGNCKQDKASYIPLSGDMVDISHKWFLTVCDSNLGGGADSSAKRIQNNITMWSM